MTWLQNILKETWNQRLHCIVRWKSGLRWFTYVLIFSFHIGCWHEQKWFMDKRMNVQFVKVHTYCVNICTAYKYIIPLSCSYFKCKNFIFHIFLMTKKTYHVVNNQISEQKLTTLNKIVVFHDWMETIFKFPSISLRWYEIIHLKSKIMEKREPVFFCLHILLYNLWLRLKFIGISTYKFFIQDFLTSLFKFSDLVCKLTLNVVKKVLEFELNEF